MTRPPSRTRIVTLTLNPALDISADVDRVEPQRKLRCRNVRSDPGGGGVNVARMVRRLGGAAFAVLTSGGPRGDRLVSLLAREGVPHQAIAIAEETRENVTVAETASGDQYRFVMPGPRLTTKEWREAVAAVERAAAEDVVVVSGSLPPGLSPSAFGRLCARLRRAGARVALDSGGPALRAALQGGGVWLVKPNLAELEDLTGTALATERDRLRACQAIVADGGARIVALSLGAEGALLVTPDGAWRARPPAIEAVSSVGAGDSFMAGLTWALCGEAAPAEALRWAVASASATVLSPGTKLGRRVDARRLLRDIPVEEIAGPRSATARGDQSSVDGAQ